MDVGAINDRSNQTIIVVAVFKDKVADGMSLTIELARELIYLSVAFHVVAHVDVGSQACAYIRMCNSVVSPPCKFCTIAYLEPAIDGSYEVFIKLTAVDTPAIYKLMRRYNCLASRTIGVGETFSNRCAVAVELTCRSIDETAFLRNRHRLWVCANHLEETLQTILLTIQEECKFAIGNTFNIRCTLAIIRNSTEISVLVMIRNSVTENGIKNIHILRDNTARVTSDVL